MRGLAHIMVLWAFLAWGQQVGFMATCGDTAQLERVAYQPAYFPWYDPLDTMVGVMYRTGYFKPYFRWWEGTPEYEAAKPPLLPSSAEAYILRCLPPVWTEKPWTRVRFDQSSHRTQLLSVLHGQTFHKKGGLTLAYKRRTREGEYLSQATDHYAAALSGYAFIGKRAWVKAEAGWNQLQDLLNGGVVFDSLESPWEAFAKASQPVRITGLRWRRWYRYAQAEVGWHTPIGVFSGEGYLREDRLQSETPLPLRGEGLFFPDTTAFYWGFKQVQRGGALRWRPFTSLQVAVHWQEQWGMGDSVLQGWKWRYWQVEGRFSRRGLVLEGNYGRWSGGSALPPQLSLLLSYTRGAFSFGGSYLSRPLPWIAYQSQWLPSLPSSNESIARAWMQYALSQADSTLPPLRLRVWGSSYRQPWLWEATPRRESVWYATGLTLEGGIQKRGVGCVSGLTAQKFFFPTAQQGWAQTFPWLNGWLQVYVRWQLPRRPPVYYLGVRFWGFTAFRPLAYEPRLGLYYLHPDLPLQPAYGGLDPYFVVHVGRVMVYLRVDHVSEGLWAKGYYLTAWYPMPGRAFSFGVQWDIYN
ncbi:MAG: putative porin [Bacteroidia bacterium]|nr:putative porin [Bacteroidia bacterium]